MTRKLAFSSIAGRNKGNARGVCQDAVFGKTLKGISCIALADGAGSKRLSGTGARKVVRNVVELVLANFDEFFEQVDRGTPETTKRKILNSILKELASARFADQMGINEYACTLIFTAAEKNRFLLGHLGDGIVLSTENGTSKVLSWPDNGEFANETFFVTSKNAFDKLRLSTELLKVPRSVLLASDGAGFSLINNSNKKIAPAVNTLCEWAATRPRKEMNIILKTNLKKMFTVKTIDDCSIAIMVDQQKLLDRQNTN